VKYEKRREGWIGAQDGSGLNDLMTRDALGHPATTYEVYVFGRVTQAGMDGVYIPAFGSTQGPLYDNHFPSSVLLTNLATIIYCYLLVIYSHAHCMFFFLPLPGFRRASLPDPQSCWDTKRHTPSLCSAFSFLRRVVSYTTLQHSRYKHLSIAISAAFPSLFFLLLRTRTTDTTLARLRLLLYVFDASMLRNSVGRGEREATFTGAKLYSTYTPYSAPRRPLTRSQLYIRNAQLTPHTSDIPEC
jgi:hypothetical protein